MKDFKIYSLLTESVCADGFQREDGSIRFYIDGEEYNQDPDMARDYLKLLPHVGYRVDWE